MIPGHLNAFRMMAEEIEIQTKLSVLFGANDFTNLVDKPGPAVWREPHDLSFVTVMREAEKLRRCGVDNSRRVRILDLAQHVDRVSLPLGPHRRDEVPEAVDRQQRRTFKWRNKEAARKMRAMMLDLVKAGADLFFRQIKNARHLVFQITHAGRIAEPILDLRSSQTRAASGSKENFLMQVRRRISGYPDVVEVSEPHSGSVKTVTNRLLRKSRRMLEAIEPLLFCC